jgi:general secretion pathway protein G
MTDKRAGFTLIEVIVVISIIMVLAGLLLPGLVKGQYLAKRAGTEAEVANMETALALYESDYGGYPADVDGNSSKPLVDALKGDRKADPPRKTYYTFKPKQIIDGAYYSVFNKPFYYRENASEKTKTEEMKKPDSYDIWTSDGKKEDQGINNWD